MSIERNKEVVRRFFDERWNLENLDIYGEMAAPNRDIQREKEWVSSLYRAFADRHLTILDLIAEGDQVAVHWRFTAMHRGDFLGVAATGRSVAYQGIAWFLVADGMIVEETAYWDILGVLQQLGAIAGCSL
jgi:steroid delta-isomerase-like uncharacterized protein